MTQRAPHDDVVAAVINYNTAAHTARCVRSLLEAGVPRVLVLDNASAPADVRLLESRLAADGSRVRFLRSDENLGFAQGCNRLIEEALGEPQCRRVLLVNSDAVVVPQGLEACLGAMRAGGHALMGGRMLKPASGPAAPAVDSLGIALYKSLLASNRMSVDDAYLGPTGGFAACTRDFLEEVRRLHGSVFEPSFFCYAEDTDLCVRARLLGASIGYVDDVVAYHAGQASNAGVYDDFILYHGIRNSIWMLARTIPAPVILRRLHWVALLHGGIVLRHTLQGRWRTLFRLYRDALAGLPAALKARRVIQATRRIRPADFAAHVDGKFYEPAFVRGALRALVHREAPASSGSADAGGASPIRLAIAPLGDDPLPGAEAGEWEAISTDPKFVATPEGGAGLEAGWYCLTARIGLIEGAVTAPQVYVADAQGRHAEARSVKLLATHDGFAAELYLPAAARSLRFDPSTTPCRFTCGALELARAPAPDAAAWREAAVLGLIDQGGLGLEITADAAPLVAEREGFRVELAGGAPDEERARRYDWIVAVRVAERAPDLVGFLNRCEAGLRETGRLVLLLPDKRHSEHRFRPPAGIARVIDAHLQRRQAHSPGSCAEHYLNVASRDGQRLWDPHATGEYEFAHSTGEARRLADEAAHGGMQADVADWCFVPHSFRLLLEDLHRLGHTALREIAFVPTRRGEFAVALGRQGTGPGLSRLELLREMDAELAWGEPAQAP